MAAIAEKELVHAPLGAADGLLKDVFAAHSPVKDAGARIVLHAGEVAQSAVVSLHPAHRPEDMTPRYTVHWEAEKGGPYPVFDGELTIGSDEDYNSFFLVLEGGYEPPGGVAGQVFDAVVGHRIAASAARNLLSEIRSEIEARFNAEEAAKHR